MIIARRTILATALAVVATAAVTPVTIAQTAGAPKVKFTQAAFEAAQASGKPILVDVSAPWCPTCKTQAPIIKSLTAKPDFKAMTIFEVDFDSQKDALRALNVQRQSTLITFKGKAETGRTVGETNAAAIEKQLRSAI
jgi:thioredoxin 1